MPVAETLVLTVHFVALGLLAIFSLHRLYLVRLLACNRATRNGAPASAGASPSTTIQLPLYNEPNVVDRLLDAVAAIEYDGPLDVQVLDDSTDETAAIAARKVAALRSAGLRIEHIRRGSRSGYKAGALAYGLRSSSSELVAVFDADFVPASDVLRRLVPSLRDPGVGMVQARWGHLNRTRSLLTRVQAIYLDAHFAIESAARHRSGCFFNFNGTAGIWKRRCIDDAGGWSANTLTEDLDLSYRAQLAGWRFVFRDDVAVPAELPESFSAFREQQHRWAKGSIQTARTVLPRLLRSRVPWRVKLEAMFHLTNNIAYLLTVIVALMLVPAIAVRQGVGLDGTMVADLVLFAISSGSVLLFYLHGQRLVGHRRPTLREIAALLPVGISISVRNSAAVLGAFFELGGVFHRTPKRGDLMHVVLDRWPGVPLAELVLASFFVASAVAFGLHREWTALPFLALFLSGFGYASTATLREQLSFYKTIP
jgi:cellulose synthase/poly-beta-1,6-N-acetylglucosamine synthase-like glycosyltransferase